MIKKLQRIKETLSDKTGYSSHLEVVGRGELMLTGCRSLLDFSPCRVICKTVSGGISIVGEGLSVTAYRADLLLVSGEISAVYIGEEVQWP